MIRVKICGVTNLADALVAAELGADAIGFIFSKSKRYVDPELAREIILKLPPFVTTVGVFVNEEESYVRKVIEVTGVDVIQFHGDESPSYCASFGKRFIKRAKIQQEVDAEYVNSVMKTYSKASAVLLDPGAGDGRSFNWAGLQGFSCREKIIVAGGLTPDNIGKLFEIFKPYAVDVSSGVEACVGKKDPERIKKFINEVRRVKDARFA